MKATKRGGRRRSFPSEARRNRILGDAAPRRSRSVGHPHAPLGVERLEERVLLDGAGLTPSGVVINEVLAHTDASPVGDWVELHNTTAAPIDLGGWYLSDDPSDLDKFRIPSGTTIAAGGYITFAQNDDFGNASNPGSLVVFSFSELGDEIVLSSPDTDGVTPICREEQVIMASDREATLGRYTRSDDSVVFVPLAAATFGAANSAPLIGPIVINEVMYDPQGGENREFIELHNASDQPVQLFDPANPANTWQVTGGVNFTFPQGTVIPARGYLLLVNTTPSTFPDAGAVPSGVQILGPYLNTAGEPGRLSNKGETFELFRPGDPELDGTVPMYLVDRLKFNDKAPWPEEAAGMGPSLVRVDLGLYGDDVSNWEASSVIGGTPGAVNQATPAEIRGTKFSDLNNNGLRDAGEPGLPGWTIYIDANGNGMLGSSERRAVTDADGRFVLGNLSAGTFVLRADFEGQDGWVQTAPTSGVRSVAIATGATEQGVDFGAVQVVAPTSVSLSPQSDTGASDTDRLTRLNNTGGAVLMFDVAGVIPGAQVQLFAGATLLGEAVATAVTMTITTNNTAALADGPHTITAVQTFGGLTSESSPELSITVDAAPPTILSTAPTEVVTGLIYTYDVETDDESGGDVAYSLTTFPPGMTIDPASGLIEWTPTGDQTGEHSVEVRAVDPAGAESLQSFTVTVTANLSPTAGDDDGGTTDEDTVRIVPAPGLLANDDDPDGDAVTILSFDDVSEFGAVVSVGQDGGFSYDPRGSLLLGTLNNGETKLDSFQYTIRDALGATATATVTINVTGVDDDPPPTLSITDVTMNEGDDGAVVYEFVVSLSHASLQTITVDVAANGDTATAGEDFEALAINSLTFDPLETSHTISVTVNGDDVFELNEMFAVVLSNAAHAAIAKGQGFGTIENDDPRPVITIGDDVAQAEGNDGPTLFQFTVSLSNPSSESITVDYTTADDTAVAGADYIAVMDTLVFAPGETMKQITVDVLGDTADEVDRSFLVNLSNATGADLDDDRQAKGTILDDDQGGSLSIADISLVETDAGMTDAVFTVTLSAAAAAPVSVDFTTENGLAIAGDDYEQQNGTVTFAPGETTKTITIHVMGDMIDEDDEDFFVALSNAMNAEIEVDRGRAKATITDDDEAPSLSIADISITEGDAGAPTADFTVTLSAPSSRAISVDFATVAGSALAGDDYESVSDTLTFTPGELTKTISVPLVTDTINEADENFFVELTAPVNAVLSVDLGEAIIVDDDPAGTIEFSQATFVAEERGGAAAITVTRTAGDASGVTVTFATGGGSASAGADYTTVTTTVTFAAGETTKTVQVPIIVDSLMESDETVDLILRDATGGATLGARVAATLTILDSPTGGEAGGPTERFVSRAYRDLLGRDAESTGMAFYQGQIQGGAMNTFDVARAIQNSPEFRVKLITDLYQNLLGRAPDAGGMSAHLRFLADAGQPDELRATILASDEYFRRNGGDGDAFLAAVYRDVLGRAIDSTGSAQFGRMLRGGTARASVVRQILASNESLTIRVRELYDTFLSRAPNAAETQFHVDALRSSLTDAQVAAGFAASDEYFARL